MHAYRLPQPLDGEHMVVIRRVEESVPKLLLILEGSQTRCLAFTRMEQAEALTKHLIVRPRCASRSLVRRISSPTTHSTNRRLCRRYVCARRSTRHHCPRRLRAPQPRCHTIGRSFR